MDISINKDLHSVLSTASITYILDSFFAETITSTAFVPSKLEVGKKFFMIYLHAVPLESRVMRVRPPSLPFVRIDLGDGKIENLDVTLNLNLKDYGARLLSESGVVLSTLTE